MELNSDLLVGESMFERRSISVIDLEISRPDYVTGVLDNDSRELTLLDLKCYAGFFKLYRMLST